MKPLTKIYIGAAGLIIATLAIYSARQTSHISHLERDVAVAKAEAATKANEANEKEKQAEIYRAKAEYLEQQLTEIQAIARRQDEQLEKLNINSSRARTDLERTRGTRTVTATAAELCAKLADLGHGCSQ